MDKELPSEILAQIASNLNLKDLNSLLRTSKNAHWKLQKHRNMLPKAEVTVHVTRNATFPQVLIFKVQQNQKCWRMTLGDIIPRNETAIEEFYYNNIDMNTLLDPIEGLSLHLQFLLSRVYVATIRLKGLLDSEIMEIIKAVNNNTTKIGSLELHTSHFKQCHEDLLIACNPQHLTIGGCHLLDSFYLLPVIQRLHKLLDSTLSHNTIDLFSLSAIDLVINKYSNIDFSTIVTYLQQWTNNKREIIRFKVAVKITSYEDELNNLKIILERNLIPFSSFVPENDIEFYLKVHRINGDESLLFSCQHGCIGLMPMEPY